MKLHPTDDRIIAVKEKAPEKTASGFLLSPGSVPPPPYCVVESIGKNITAVKVGDKLLVKNGYENGVERFSIDEDEYVSLTEADIIATVTIDKE